MTTFARLTEIARHHEVLAGLPTTDIDFWSTILAQSPTDYTLRQCFLATFLQSEHVYVQQIIDYPVGKSISFDHTFRIAANIGYTRKDGKWIQQYDSLFAVVSEYGKIVTWQLTRGTSLGEVHTLLKDLNKRCNALTAVYVDDCCKLRRQIQSVFGRTAIVRLDLFHATQRITRTLNRKCTLYTKCTQDLTLVFRTAGDSEKARSSPTPSPDIMLSNLNAFTNKWNIEKDVNGLDIFTSSTSQAIENLKQHVTYGCLSEIPIGGGTNRNERFHHQINSVLHRNKIRILMAYALLTIVIHAYNSRV